MRVLGRLAGVLLASASAGWVSPAMAQDPPTTAAAENDETVVVTARRRSETLFETPATVTAVGGQTLRDLGVTDIKAAIQLIPNAVVPQDPQSFNTYVNIRGIRQADPQAEPNFGLYRNGIFAGGQRTNLGAQVDIARFEVLRGPQGGLYGKDAVGGAINIVYATPTGEFGGYASASYGRYNRFEVEGAVNAPVSDTFAVRIAGWYFDQDEGEFFNVARNEEVDRMNDKGLRFSARLDFNDAWSVVWMAEYQETDGPSARTFAPNGVSNFGTMSPPETPRTIRRNTPLRAETEQLYLSQDLKFESESAGTFNLLAAYRDYTLDSTEDQDYTALPVSLAPFVLDQVLTRDEGIESAYVELVWTSPEDQKLTWIAGASYYHETFDFSRVIGTTLDFNLLGFMGLPPIGVRSAAGALPGPGSSITTESFSAFVDFTYALSDTFDLTAGLRYSSDTKELDYAQYVIGTQPSLPLFQILFASQVPTFSLRADPTFDHWSPSFGFRYRASENVNIYGVVSDGFRAGGFNTTSTNPALIPFGSEGATNYELGVKTQWNGGRLGLNLAVFYMEQSDLLVRREDPVVPNPFAFTYLDNAGDARTYGVEVELFARLSDWLSAAASVGWLDAKYSSGDAFGTPLKGQRIPYTRDWTVNVRLDADIPINDDWSVVGTLSYRGEFGGAIDDFGLDPYEDLNKLDASLGVAIGDTRIVGYIENAFDEKITEFIFAVGAETLSYGRTYGARISTNF